MSILEGFCALNALPQDNYVIEKITPKLIPIGKVNETLTLRMEKFVTDVFLGRDDVEFYFDTGDLNPPRDKTITGTVTNQINKELTIEVTFDRSLPGTRTIRILRDPAKDDDYAVTTDTNVSFEIG